MQVVTGAWLCLAGILAGRGRAVLRWPGQAPVRADDRGRRMLVQLALPDGRIVEQSCPEPRKASALLPGQKVSRRRRTCHRLTLNHPPAQAGAGG